MGNSSFAVRFESSPAHYKTIGDNMDLKVIFLDVDGVLNLQDDLMAYRKKNNIEK